jgi:hypothetical protein
LPRFAKRTKVLANLHEPLSTENPMIPFVIVKTKAAFAYLRPEHIVAISATDPAECLVLMTHGVSIAALERAEDIVARIEAEAREEDEASKTIQKRK